MLYDFKAVKFDNDLIMITTVMGQFTQLDFTILDSVYRKADSSVANYSLSPSFLLAWV